MKTLVPGGAGVIGAHRVAEPLARSGEIAVLDAA